MNKIKTIIFVVLITTFFASCSNAPTTMEKSVNWTFLYKQDSGTLHIINDNCSSLYKKNVSCSFTQPNYGEIWLTKTGDSCKSAIEYKYDADNGLLNIIEIVFGKSNSSPNMNYDVCFYLFKGKYKWEKRDELLGFRFYSLSNPNLSLYCEYGNCSK